MAGRGCSACGHACTLCRPSTRQHFHLGLCSWSTSGLGFASFWLLGFLRVFDGSVQPLWFVGALSPLLGALWIGMSRIQVPAACLSGACWG